MWEIRPAQPSDAQVVTACVEAAYYHYIATIGNAPGPMLDDYARVIADHLVWVVDNSASDAAMSDAEIDIAGLVVLIEKSGGILLDNIAVHPKDQRQGLGKRLMQFAESEAQRRGYGAIELYTHVKMVENIALYQRLGYSETDRRTEKGLERVYMQKSFGFV